MTSSYRAMSGVSATGFDQWAGFPSEVIVNMSQRSGSPRHLAHRLGTAARRPSGLPPSPTAPATRSSSASGARAPRVNRGTFWANSFNLYDMSGAYPQSASLLPDYDACLAIASDIAQCKYGWGSFHTGVINFVLGDGSVRPLEDAHGYGRLHAPGDHRRRRVLASRLMNGLL